MDKNYLDEIGLKPTRQQVGVGVSPFVFMQAPGHVSQEERRKLLERHRAELSGQIREHEAELAFLEASICKLESARSWVAQLGDRPRLQRVETSFFHKALGDIYFCNKEGHAFVDEARIGAQVFLIQHDWAGLIAGTDAATGEFCLPADPMVAEFRVEERQYILIYCGGRLTEVLQTPYGWVAGEVYPIDGEKVSGSPFHQQVRAMCILLESEVCDAPVVRAPHHLNERRREAGRVPLYDYRVVRLSPRRQRFARDGDTGTHRSPRLHFRRGHWRHYKTHKTWVRWTLVGNPDLGFVDKVYA